MYGRKFREYQRGQKGAGLQLAVPTDERGVSVGVGAGEALQLHEETALLLTLHVQVDTIRSIFRPPQHHLMIK